MAVAIQSIEIAVPENRVLTEEILATISHKISDRLRETVESLCVEQRYSIIQGYADYLDHEIQRVLLDTTTSLAKKAVFKAIEQADIKSEDIGLLIGITNTPDRPMPCMSYEIIAASGDLLPRDICVINMQSQGCATLLKAIEIARGFLQMNPDKNVVVVSSEGHTGYAHCLSRPFYRSLSEIEEGAKGEELEDTKDLIASLLFGDGAVAMVLRDDENGAVVFDKTVHLSNMAASDAELLTMDQGGIINPCYQGFPHYYMSKNVPKKGTIYAKYLIEELKKYPGYQNVNLGELDQYFIHTGSKKIIDGVCSMLQIPSPESGASSSYNVLRNYGNLSACSVGFMIYDFLSNRNNQKSTDPMKEDSLGVVISFGVGFSGSAGVVRLH